MRYLIGTNYIIFTLIYKFLLEIFYFNLITYLELNFCPIFKISQISFKIFYFGLYTFKFVSKVPYLAVTSIFSMLYIYIDFVQQSQLQIQARINGMHFFITNLEYRD